MTQALSLPAAGLMTDPGPFTAAPDGGMLEAQNVVVLRPGVMEPRPGALLIKDAILKSNSDEASACYADPSSNVFVWASFPDIIRLNGTTTITGPTSFIGGKIRTCPTGGRALTTSENGVCTLPGQLASPASGSATIAYRAGMPQPYCPRAVNATPWTGLPAGAAWLPVGESVAYRVTLRRTLANGTIVESAPSGRIVYTNTTAGASGVAITDWPNNAIYYAWIDEADIGAQGYGSLIPGDELCIYRSPRINGTPSDSMSLLAVVPFDVTLSGFGTLADAAFHDFRDDGDWSGPKLYTNATQEGALLANYRPEYARDIALYKGMTFYAGAQTSQRVDLTLSSLGTLAGTTDPSQALLTFAFTANIAAATTSIVVAAADIRYFSVGQVITTAAQAPGTASAAFPANTYVTEVNTTINRIDLSQTIGATVVGAALVTWDWVESSVSGTRIYHNEAGTTGTVPTNRWFLSAASTFDGRWSGPTNNRTAAVQLRCSGESQTTEIVCSWFRPDVTAAAFSIRSSKPLAWDRYVDSVTGVTSQQSGSVAELQWSKINEPEHCPLPYRTQVGDAAYAIRRIEAARNSLLIFKDDGLYQCFGDTPDTLTFELLDRTLIIPAPKDAFGDEPCKWVGRFDDRVFAMTTRGPMAIGDAGARPVGAPILESLRQRFQFGFGANDESLRALMIDTQARRVGFFYDLDGTGDAGTAGYVLDVETGTWTYWTFTRPVADFSVVTSLGAAICAGSYYYGYFLDNRTMLDDGTVTVTTMPSTYESWQSETCTIDDYIVGATSTYVLILPGSEWTPTVGDLLIQGGVGYVVVSVMDSVQFTVESDALNAPTFGSATWRESYEARCVWLARSEHNVGGEKHWRFADFPFELTTLFSRYVDPSSSIGRMKSYFRGYRNTAAAIENFVDTAQTIGGTPWPLAPAWKHIAVPTAVARDWALRVGFSIRQAGVWFATAGISVLFESSDPGKVSR